MTGSGTVFCPAAKVSVGGTKATLVLLELTMTVIPPAGAAADRFKIMFCVPAPMIVRLGGV